MNQRIVSVGNNGFADWKVPHNDRNYDIVQDRKPFIVTKFI